jgi:hypothetical protein
LFLLKHQYPWAKANMAIDVRNIYWGDCFALSIGILSPTEFRSPADLSRGFSRFIAGFHPIYRGVFLSPTEFNCPMDLSQGKFGLYVLLSPTDFCSPADLSRGIDVRNIYWDDNFSLSFGILSPMEFRSHMDSITIILFNIDFSNY